MSNNTKLYIKSLVQCIAHFEHTEYRMNKVLTEQLIDKVQREGPVTFAYFMQQALYAPGLGYYSSGQQKFGEAGDFITAPELSPLFSQCIARQYQQVLSQLIVPIILEFGAGSGAMAVDILLTLEKLGCLPKQYWILELSAELQQRQQQLFEKRAPHFLPNVEWLSSLPAVPFEGIILANEVLDAMPINKFRMQKDLEEAYVDYKNYRFIWHWDKPTIPLQNAFSKLDVDLALDYESELNSFVGGWIKSLSNCLSKGLVLLVDYGFPRREYYHPDRSMGTIMCHYQHRAHSDPLVSVGLQDITAHVDFTAVAEAAVENDFDVEGYTNQAAFLIDCGIIDLAQNAKDDIERFNWNSQVKRLTLPGEMGELFKVIALTKDFDQELLGFRTLNQIERL